MAEQHNRAKVRDRSPVSSPDDIELSEAARLQLKNAAAGNKDAAQDVARRWTARRRCRRAGGV